MKSYARKEASLQKTKRFTVAVDVGVLSKLGISHCEFLLQLFFFFLVENVTRARVKTFEFVTRERERGLHCLY